VPECHKKGELDQYGAECFGRLISATNRNSGFKRVNYNKYCWA